MSANRALALRGAGCYACRKMKVKCDEQKPSCFRCERAGRQCPGYKTPGDTIFRSMNESAHRRSQKAKRRPNGSAPTKTLAALSGSDSPDHQSNSSDGRSARARPSPEVFSDCMVQPMPTDWHQQAICHFFEDYVVPVENNRVGYLNFLPGMYQQNENIPYFIEALRAVSMASLANRTSMASLVIRARKSYGRALALVNTALGNEKLAKSDSLLVSLMLLTKYELISGDKSTLWESHTAGQVQLIHLRGEEQYRTDTGRDLYRWILARQRLADLAYQRIPTMGNEVPAESLYPNPAGARMANLVSRICNLYGILPRSGSATLAGRAFPESWVHDVLAVEEEIRTWKETVPIFWRPQIIRNMRSSSGMDMDESPIYPNVIKTYTGILQASAWNIIWCFRIHLLHAMLEYRSTLSSQQALDSLLPTKTEIYQDLQTMVDEVCSNVPFMLGEIDQTGALRPPGKGRAIGAYLLIWALHVAGSVRILSETQKDWIAGQLSHIGYVVGIRQALVLRDLRATQRASSSGFALSFDRMSAWEQLR